MGRRSLEEGSAHPVHPVFTVAEIDVSNVDAYGKEYAPKAQALIRAKGGKVLVGSNNVVVLEGQPRQAPRRSPGKAWRRRRAGTAPRSTRSSARSATSTRSSASWRPRGCRSPDFPLVARQPPYERLAYRHVELAHGGDELLELERLLERLDCANLARDLKHVELHPRVAPAHGDDLRFRKLPAQVVDRLDAFHFRHEDVRHDHVGRPGALQRQSLGAIGGAVGFDAAAAEPAQRERPEVLVVLDDKNAHDVLVEGVRVPGDAVPDQRVPREQAPENSAERRIPPVQRRTKEDRVRRASEAIRGPERVI